MSEYTGQTPETRRAPDWREYAACLGRGNEMFPDNSEHGIANAKRICTACRVRLACLDDALRAGDNHWGIRGGMKPEERRKLAKNLADRKNSLTELPRPAKPKEPRPTTLAEAIERRTAPTDDGHVLWCGAATHIQFEGKRYTGSQAAFLVGHGREPEGMVRRTCGTDCFRSDHLTDAVIRDSAARCGTRPGYQRHRKNGEKACDACRRANTDADNRLRRTGTTKELAS